LFNTSLIYRLQGYKGLLIDSKSGLVPVDWQRPIGLSLAVLDRILILAGRPAPVRPYQTVWTIEIIQNPIAKFKRPDVADLDTVAIAVLGSDHPALVSCRADSVIRRVDGRTPRQ